MTTPLFPAHDRLTVRQGRYGNCYLLALFDCMFQDPETLRILKERITYLPDGRVQVRFKRGNQVINEAEIRSKKIGNKNKYEFSKTADEDVFILDADTLADIDRSSTSTNSLAVKIVEHLISYYYVNVVIAGNPFESMAAHNIPGRNFSDSGHYVVAGLFGISAHRSLNIDEIIKLKKIAPNVPVYVGMDYGRVDAHGRRHGLHALRVREITASGEFVLVNPWDNSITERYTLTEMRGRNPFFSFLHANESHFELIKILLNCPEAAAANVYANRELFSMVLHMKTVYGPPRMSSAAFQHYLTTALPFMADTYRKVPFLFPLFNTCFRMHLEVVNCVIQSTDEQTLISSFLAVLITNNRTNMVEILFKELIANNKNDLAYAALKQLADKQKWDMAKLVLKQFVDGNHRGILETILKEQDHNIELGNRLVEIAIEKKANAAPHIFDANFYQLVLRSAIHYASISKRITLPNAQNLIETQLMHLYFRGSLPDYNFISSGAGLRQFAAHNIFDKALIPLNITQDKFLVFALNYFWDEPSISSLGIQYLQVCTPVMITPQVRNGFFNPIRMQEPKAFFAMLYELHRHNALFSATLFSTAVKKMEELFPGAYDKYFDEITRGPESDFIRWIKKENNKLVPGAEFIADYVKQIKALDMSFPSDLDSVGAVETHQKALRQKVLAYLNDPHYIKVKNALGSTDPIEVTGSIQAQLLLIDTTAETLIKKQHEHHKIAIESWLKDLFALKIDYSHAVSSQSVDSQRKRFLDQLDVLKLKPLVQQDINKPGSIIHSEFNKVLNLINTAAQAQKDKILKDKSSLIQAIDVDYTQQDTSAKIDQHSQALITRLEYYLGSESRTHGNLRQAFDQKRNEILSTAEQAKEIINKQTIELLLQELGAFNVDYKTARSTSEVNTRQKEFLRQLDGLQTKPAFASIQAEFNKVGSLVNTEFKRLKQRIEVAAEVQKDTIYKEKIPLISAITVDYAQLNTLDTIGSHCRSLLIDLENALRPERYDETPWNVRLLWSQKQEEILKQGRLAEERIHRQVISEIQAIQVDFAGKDSIEDVNSHHQSLLNTLNTIPTHNAQPIVQAFDEKKREIEQKKNVELQRIQEENREAARAFLARNQFDDLMAKVNRLLTRLEGNARDNPNKYHLAAEAARTLRGRLESIETGFLNNGKSLQDNIVEFKGAGNTLIQGALEILEQHRGAKAILKAIADALISFFRMDKKSPGPWGIFAPPKTESEKEVRAIEEQWKNIR